MHFLDDVMLHFNRAVAWDWEASFWRTRKASREKGISELLLLSTTASDFLWRKGYVDVTRSTGPMTLRVTTQAAKLCPASAVCVKKSFSLP